MHGKTRRSQLKVHSNADSEKTDTQRYAKKGWNIQFRLYGPLEPWFDKVWKPGEFVEVK